MSGSEHENEFQADPDRERVELTKPGRGIGVLVLFVAGAFVVLGVMVVIAVNVLG